MQNASVWYLDKFFHRMLCRCRSTTCERSIFTIQWPSVSTSHVGIRKMTISPYSPHMAEQHKRSVTAKLLNWSSKKYQIIWKAVLNMQKCQKWKAKNASSHNKKINEMVAKSVKMSVKEIFQTHMKTLKQCNHKILIVIWNMNTITWKMSV